MIIAVIGNAECPPDVALQAEEVGRLLAKNGATIICGGLGGVMEAACRAAKENGGLTIGVLPGTNPGEANPYVDLPIATGMGQARNVIVAISAQAVIAISGGYGTLSEIGLALKHGVPVVGLGSWQLPGEHLILAKDAEDAVAKALDLAKKPGARSRGRLE
ncbi:MAG: TIGR00725 family protein [Chloroflexi bacterium]|nr:TIGR00725 family protein [Chloroflexota bacterium]